MLSGWVSAARMTSSLVPRLILCASRQPDSVGRRHSGRSRHTTWSLRSGALVSRHSPTKLVHATYSALLELPVVARLLHAVQKLLDEGGVLGLGPGSRLVGRHVGVGRSGRKRVAGLVRGRIVSRVHCVCSPWGCVAVARGCGCMRGKTWSNWQKKKKKKAISGQAPSPRNLAVSAGRMG